MSYSWYRFQQPPMYPQPFHYATEIAHSVPQAAQAAAQAASAAPAAAAAPITGAVNAAMHTAQSAFTHPPHLPPTYGAQPHPYYAEFGRAYRRGCYRSGPRLFPLLIVGGFGFWTLHRIRSLEDRERARDWQDKGREMTSVAAAPAAFVATETSQSPRRGWGRRRREEEASMGAEERRV